MANPVAATNHAGYDQALAWAQQNLAAGVDSESLVNGLIQQGWPEYDARMVLDTALSRPAMSSAMPPPVPAMRGATGNPAVVNYASARPDRQQQMYRSALKDAYRKRMLIGGAWFAVGVVVTVGSMAAASGGGGYLLFWGPIIFGGYRMVTGFIGWVSN